MKARTKMTCAAIFAAAVVLFVAGCGGDGADQQQDRSTGNNAVSAEKAVPANGAAVSADRVAALEKDVVKLRNEVQQLRHWIEVDAKMRSRNGMSPYSRQPGSRNPEDLRDAEFRARHFARRNGSAASGNPAAERQDPATMTPEQRRAWHEERRKMREERRQKMLEERKREKISESGKTTSQNNTKEESK